MVVKGPELIFSRRAIRAMIEADPISVVFFRREEQKVYGGGFVYSDPVALAPQRVRILPMKRRLSDVLSNTELGDVINAPYVLLGLHTLDAKKGDRFVANGEEMEISSFDILEPEVKTLAVINYFGRTPNG